MRPPFRLGELVVDLARGIVLRPDGAHTIGPRAVEALTQLAQRPVATVERGALTAQLWPDGSGNDDGLVHCISDLRRSLGDSGKTHRIIETIPRHGYRLAVEPTELVPGDEARLTAAARRLRPGTQGWRAMLRSARVHRTLRVLGVYAAAAAGVVQLSDVVFERLGMPESSVNVVIALAVLGLLVASAAAWLYKPPSGQGQYTPATFAKAGALLIVSSVAISYVVAARLHPPEPTPERSVAVLPFDNISGDRQNNYLGDGLADEITSKLTRVPGLEVASRTSAFAFRGSQANAQTIGAALGVRHILEGSIRREQERLRVTAQLIDSKTGYHLWSKTFDRARTDLLDIEENISGSVLEALRIVLSPEAVQNLTEKVTENADAYDAYLRGIAALRQAGGMAAIETSISQFKRALAIDPTIAEAYAGLCQADVERYEILRAPNLVASAESSCAQARRLDSELPDVHLALGMLHSATGQFGDAEIAYRKAIRYDPNLTEAYLGLAQTLAQRGEVPAAEATLKQARKARPRYWLVYREYGTFLLDQGRPADAAVQYRRATELAPDNASVFSNLGGAYFMAGDFAQAATAFRRSVELAPTSEGYSNTATMYYYVGQFDEAVKMFEQATRIAPEDHVLWGNLADAYRFSSNQAALSAAAYEKADKLVRATLRVNPDDPLARTLLAYYLARQGRVADARSELAQAGAAASTDAYVNYFAALVQKELGHNALALEYLRKAVAAGYPRQVLSKAAELGDLRNDPLFAELQLDPDKEQLDASEH